MNPRIQSLRERLAIHRKNIADLENTRAQYGLDVPLHVTREIEQQQKEIHHLKAEIRAVNTLLAKELNDIRRLVVDCLDDYIQLSSKLNEFENMFLTYVLLPGFQLQQSVQQRRFLEREYNRIRGAIDRGIYTDAKEIERDIEQTLRHAEIAYAYKDSDQPEAEQADDSVTAGIPASGMDRSTPDAGIDEATQKEIIRYFKRIVLPKVHADTSDAPFEVFNAAYEAYKKRDYVLIAAFVIKYQGELHPNQEEPAEFLDQIAKFPCEYRWVQDRLQQRLVVLKEDVITQKLDDQAESQIQMKKQNREIRRAAYEEAERIANLRECLQDLRMMSFEKKEGNR